jgi:hypothetical protein
MITVSDHSEYTNKYRNLRFTTDEFGDIRFNYASVGDIQEFISFLNSNMADRDLVVLVLHHQIQSPEIDISDIQKLTDHILLKLAVYWGESDLQVPDEPISITSFTEFRNALIERLDKIYPEWK